ncbi:peptide chain release factor N(5)-glutamine methyltransferase [Aquimarina sp. MMG016]|uniref:peptide chain release factor N(5)-glutamine methyltransferase n=1 Tax=Aquimarina sp. MMG016 TaxID=2822690 RepID=UPI001B39FCC1|nr:peptide chain release factor N(5)-glutamine methyltransferase [Aquimarina sp. MMG016]MBQ4821186.1 peptide chain release factor N(5)-glutamine methyltransferase [Aquimarina sp. MMG016]
MKLKNLREDFVRALSRLYDADEVMSFFYILTEEVLGFRRVDVALNLEKKLSDNEVLKFSNIQQRLENQEPIQYILGEAEFYGLRFKVDSNVLIPRPETEELVDWIIKDYRTVKDKIKILDIGTGSGCIAVTLAKKIPNAEVYAIDISQKAIEVARNNAKFHNVEIKFIHKDILAENDLAEKFSVIVSNPPYVRELEKQEMRPNVLDHEPYQALFVSDEKPLVFYKKITELALQSLKAEGVLYFEINQYLSELTKKMMKETGFNSLELRKDIRGNDRMIKANRN